jgi:hypothetical protein
MHSRPANTVHIAQHGSSFVTRAKFMPVDRHFITVTNDPLRLGHVAMSGIMLRLGMAWQSISSIIL